ncbi:MAG: DegT/DnrJ/EryC1/StrS family aminotransferase, partial [Selenomonadaceae bacterium]|nr:DegT/DnrJ/EryC1/StrS family aminotransferase [Selenomonadaceae bacterium]
KVFNSVEGGAVTFSDSKIYEKLYNLKNFGIRGEELITQVGANAKMNEFCAIMGLCNLKHIHEAI